jgi:poly-gamma-glutamate synthesis protein (capsule biosynthesis protein)
MTVCPTSRSPTETDDRDLARERESPRGLGTVRRPTVRSREIRLIAVGDIMLGRDVGRRIGSESPIFRFAGVREALRAADIAFGNLECPVTTRSKAVARQDPHVTFRASPAALPALRDAGFAVLSLANNHIGDHGPGGIDDTRRYLSDVGILGVGAGRDDVEARRGGVLVRNGCRVGFLAYNAAFEVGTHTASARRAGPAHLVLRDAERDIRRLRRAADVVVVSVHWGIEYDDYPVPVQMRMARAMIDAGATVVLGHGPHHVQGLERYGRGLIAYSLGDFVFDEPYPKTKESVMLECTVDATGVSSWGVTPVAIDADYRPVPAAEPQGRDILERVARLSDEYQGMPAEVRDERDALFVWEVCAKLAVGTSWSILRNLDPGLLSPGVVRSLLGRLADRRRTALVRLWAALRLRGGAVLRPMRA